MKSKKRFIKNLMAAEQDLSNKHGGFSLFAACFREDTMLDTWDLVVAASWLLPETKNSYTTIMDGIRRNMDNDEIFDLHALPLLDPDDFRILEIHDEYGELEHGFIDLGRCQLFDMDMERVYIITSKRRDALVSAEVNS